VIDTMASDPTNQLKQLAGELENFEDIARSLLPQPGELPQVEGIDLYGGTLALNGVIGGDHLIYVDFKQRFDLEARIALASAAGRTGVVDNLKRCQHMAGVVLMDIAGHRITDALLAAMMHQAFLLGAVYELDMFGQITRRLFENLNTRFYQSSGAHKFASMIYGEISDHAMFRFLSCAQPLPLVFSKHHGRFMDVSENLRVSFPPIGVMPSLDVIDRTRTSSLLGFKDEYQMNEWLLMGEGDILLLHSDGLAEHHRDEEPFASAPLEETLRQVHHLPARGIFDAIMDAMLAFSPPTDDISIVVIKRK
jgi:serine phosphatase RsbU (regulator of sigma subunit)